MTRRLRHRSSEKNGLVLANGGVLTSHYAAVLSSSPRGSGAFPVNALLPEYVNISRPEIVEKAEGDAVVEVCLPTNGRGTEADLTRRSRWTLRAMVGRRKDISLLACRMGGGVLRLLLMQRQYGL